MIPIGIIDTPFKDMEGTPIQPRGVLGIQGTVELLQEFQLGLKDLDGFSHVILLYLFHRRESFKLEVIPFMDVSARSVFATRAPKRPKPIGLSVVELERIGKNFFIFATLTSSTERLFST
jgi:tRNA-Thr(GGU) m(6)t(6)A37 methyltransferase TsaA